MTLQTSITGPVTIINNNNKKTLLNFCTFLKTEQLKF